MNFKEENMDLDLEVSGDWPEVVPWPFVSIMPLSVVENVEIVEPLTNVEKAKMTAHGGGDRRRGRGARSRGAKAIRGSRGVQRNSGSPGVQTIRSRTGQSPRKPRPTAMDELQIFNIEDLPRGEPLETPLTQKKSRPFSKHRRSSTSFLTSTPVKREVNFLTSIPASIVTSNPAGILASTPAEQKAGTPTEIPTSTPVSSPTNILTSTPASTLTKISTSTPASTLTKIPTSTPASTPTNILTSTPAITQTNISTSAPANKKASILTTIYTISRPSKKKLKFSTSTSAKKNASTSTITATSNLTSISKITPTSTTVKKKAKKTSTSANILASTSASSPLSQPHSRPRKPLQEANIFDEHFNYGSESGSASEEDELLVPMIGSRVYQASVGTALNEEETSELPACIKTEPSTVALFNDCEGPVRPNDLFHFEWRQFPDPLIPPNERREPFTQVGVGPSEPCTDPYTIFVSIWDANIMARIVNETNKYAQDIVLQQLHDNSLGPRSRICLWEDTTIDELYTYFAIILAMGIVIKSSLEEYWNSKCEIFSTPVFQAHISLIRFQLLNTCLHFHDNRGMRGRELSIAEAKLFKMEPILNHLNSKFQSMYTMSQNIALDESLMQWNGWLAINQFIPSKAAKSGVKIFELCESQTGYLWRFDVHAKKHFPQDQQAPMDAFTPTIVLDLLRGLEGKGYTVWMDNFYNSPALARQLKVLGFDVVGTLRANRQFVPQELRQLSKGNMQKGQITGFTSGDVDVMVWFDRSIVSFISTYHGNKTAVCDDKVKPCAILDYNIMMGGVDKKDQLLSTYPIERKRAKVWYKKIFRRLINVSVLNSYVIARKSGSNLKHRNFRKILIQSLLSRHSVPKDVPVPADSHVFHAKTHHLLEYPVGANKSRLRRRCHVCKNLTHFYCAGCNKTVCISNCFVNLHS